MAVESLTKEQKIAINHDSGNILISASAGSGKTHVMIERLIKLITSKKTEVKRVLAVTFTDLAAGEMKEKLRKALIDQINKSKDESLMSQLNDIGCADICTIDSFCARLIRTYFYQVGLVPDFKVLAEGQDVAIKRECIDQVFNKLYQDKEEWFLALTNRHKSNRTDDELKKFILVMHSKCFANSDSAYYQKLLDKFYTAQGYRSLISLFKQEIDKELDVLIDFVGEAHRVFVNANDSKIDERCVQFLNDITRFREDSDIYSAKKYADYKISFNCGKKLPEITKAKAIISRAKDIFTKIISTICTGFTDLETDEKKALRQAEHLGWLYQLTFKFDQAYKDAKKQEKGLDFTDLERYAEQILQDEKVREEIKNRYDYIFVDEYQDVNDVQENLISLLANDNVFMVGDAKQSIYGFRGCKPKAFIEKYNHMKRTGETTVELNHNFRSCQNVIDLVNRIFNFSMTENSFGMSYEKTSQLQAGGTYPSHACGRVQLHSIKMPSRQEKEIEQPRVYNILDEIKKKDVEKESHTANLLASIIREELRKDYFDAKKGEYLPVRFKDITILTRNRANAYVKDVVRGLKGCGIPVKSVVQDNALDSPEIKMMIEVVKLIDNFSCDIPLATTLKSPIGNFTDEELAKIVLNYKDNVKEKAKKTDTFYNAFIYCVQNLDDQVSLKAKAFYEYFSNIRRLAQFMGAHGILNKLVIDKDIEQYLYASTGGESKVNRLHVFISQAKTPEKTLSIKEFLLKIKRNYEAFSISENKDEDAVTVMTMHSSKGLEFPVVIVCGLEKSMNGRKEDDVLFDQELGFALDDYDDKNKIVRQTPFKAIFRQRLATQTVKEELRLLYVALTRATYSLHITFTQSADKRSSVFMGASKFIDYIPSDIEVATYDYQDLEGQKVVVEPKKVLVGKVDEQKKKDMLDKFSYQYPYLLDTILPLKNSVTKATHTQDEDTPLTHVLLTEECPDIEKGIIAHKIMEHLDFSKRENYLEQVDQMILKGIITLEQKQKVNLDRIGRALTSKAFDGIDKMTLLREKQFIVQIPANQVFDTQSTENVLLQGVIDLLAYKDNEAIIVDYKYSSLEQNSLLRKYKQQLDLYEYALYTATGIKTTKKVLINLFTGDNVIVD